MKTERLHYDDPRLLSFEATVVGHLEHRGRPSLQLDRTAFYAEAGGQMSDRGTIDRTNVVDVQLDDDGRIHHVIDGELPPLGARVAAVIDGRRRREHMALHTGQHALSRALLDELAAVTVSSRLGETACTIDVDREGLSLADVRRAEDRVNALIDEDREVRQFFPSDRELEGMSLRKPPPQADRVRVVAIEGFDITPCGGTHCTHTAQIELMWIQSVERYKKGTRITFAAGPRARRLLAGESAALRSLASEMRCAPAEVPDLIAKLNAKLDQARDEAGVLRMRLAERWIERLGESREVIAAIPDADPSLLKTIAERLATADRLIALAAPQRDGTDVLIARGPASTVACGALLSAIAKACGGRGGGRPEHAQGRLPAAIAWSELVREALGKSAERAS